MGFLSDLPEILEAVLAILGGLKLISRYTPWKWDDKIFEAAEAPAKKAFEFAKAFRKPKDK